MKYIENSVVESCIVSRETRLRFARLKKKNGQIVAKFDHNLPIFHQFNLEIVISIDFYVFR